MSRVQTPSIDFCGPMIRAIQSGMKTQTRRVVKDVEPDDELRVEHDQNNSPFVVHIRHHQILGEITCPYANQRGDELWVREEHYRFGHWEPVPGVKTRTGRQKWQFVAHTDRVLFDAPDGVRSRNTGPLAIKPGWYKRLARFMPRWASRITLEVTGLRIERLNDISEADAIAEGCDVDLLASLIAPLANRAVVEPHYWLRNDAGRSFCRKCGEKKVRQINKDCREKNENLDGGWDTEEDGPAFCDTCGVMLDCTYTDHAVRDEIDHFSEYGITSPADAHSLETALHVHGNPRLTKSCGTFHYRPELTGTVAKICFRHLWESINGPDSWDANPWVWVVEFKQVELCQRLGAV